MTKAAPEPRRVLMTVDAVGGVWTYALELAAGLAPLGVEVLLASMGPRPSAAQRAAAAALPNVRLEVSGYRLEWMDDAWDDVEEAGDWLLELACDFQADLIHLNGYVHAARPWGCPVLVCAHSCVLSWWEAVKRAPAPPEWDEYQRRVERGLAAADLVVAPTRAIMEALQGHYAFSTPRQVIPNGREVSRFQRAASKQPVIMAGGRLWDEAKNIALLQAAAPRLRWPVHVAGAGQWQESGDAIGPVDGVRMLGQLRPEQMAEALLGASIYAAPARYEPFGLGILEAALAGAALVLADIPSLRENWDGAAVFVSPWEAEEWITALNGLAKDPPALAQLSAAAKARAQHFSQKSFIRAYAQTYRELTASSRLTLHPSCV